MSEFAQVKNVVSRSSRTLSGTGKRRVALLVHTSNEWIRQVLRGIAGFAHEMGGWDFYLEPAGLDDEIRLPRFWQADGAITRLTSPKWGRALLAAGFPVVNVSWMGRHSLKIPKVASDERACAGLVARHFLERGFRQLGYVGPVKSPGYDRPGYEDLLQAEFASVAESAGANAYVYDDKFDQRKPLHLLRNPLEAWLSQLPLPVGLMVWNSETAREITFACDALGLKVPQQVAVICVEFDSVMSSLAPVPLSSLDQGGSRVGYEAAKLLSALMDGQTAPAAPVRVPPLGIVHRQSSNTTAVSDEVVAAANRYIHEHLAQIMSVKQICEALGVSRRSLEARFAAALGTTPAAELRRAKLEKVKRMLAETDLPLKAIAPQCGFNYADVMVRNFTREFGTSPSAFRRGG